MFFTVHGHNSILLDFLCQSGLPCLAWLGLLRIGSDRFVLPVGMILTLNRLPQGEGGRAKVGGKVRFNVVQWRGGVLQLR